MTQTPSGSERPADRSPFPFFVGTGRSGTTLIRAMFDSHPDMAIPPVSDFIAPLLTERERFGSGGRLDVDGVVDALFSFERFRKWGLSRDEVQAALAGSRDVPDAVRRLFETYARRAGKPRTGDKTASYVMHVPLIAAAFPEAVFVHMIRDGRNVALSYMESKEAKWGPSNIAAGTMRWKRRIEEGRNAGRALGSSRYHEVRYEELVEDPESVLRRLCEFLRLPFDDSMLRFHERAGDIVGPLTNPEANRNIYQPVQSKTREWQDQMSSEQLEFFEAIAGSTLTEFGYARALERIPVGARLRALAGIARFRGAASLHRLRARTRGIPAAG